MDAPRWLFPNAQPNKKPSIRKYNSNRNIAAISFRMKRSKPASGGYARIASSETAQVIPTNAAQFTNAANNFIVSSFALETGKTRENSAVFSRSSRAAMSFPQRTAAIAPIRPK